jgi:hypothetical protein
MDRRGFLTTLFGGATAAVLLPRIDLTVAKNAPAWNDIEKLQWDSTYSEALSEAHRIFCTEMSSHGFHIHPMHTDRLASRIGERAWDGIVMTTQKSVLVTNTDTERCLIPAMSCMANELSHRGIDRFGTLILPQGVEFSGIRGPLRMCVQYQIEHGYVTRFDVLGGSSPEAQRVVRAYDAEYLKSKIRRRLGTYRNPSRLM